MYECTKSGSTFRRLNISALHNPGGFSAIKAEQSQTRQSACEKYMIIYVHMCIALCVYICKYVHI